jgi:ABC-type Zn2+ transport system substrate-binding protein/surface adhesin
MFNLCKLSTRRIISNKFSTFQKLTFSNFGSAGGHGHGHGHNEHTSHNDNSHHNTHSDEHHHDDHGHDHHEITGEVDTTKVYVPLNQQVLSY